jgi:hypothetical protein
VQEPPANETLLLAAGGSLFFGFYSPLLNSWFRMIPQSAPEKIHAPQAFLSPQQTWIPICPLDAQAASPQQTFFDL